MSSKVEKALAELIALGKVEEKKKKKRIKVIEIQRDNDGKRTFPYAGKKKKKVTKKSSSANQQKTSPTTENIGYGESSTAVENTAPYNEDSAMLELQGLGSCKKNNVKNWSERMEEMEKCWSDNHDQIRNIVVEKEELLGCCLICKLHTAVIRCADCLNDFYSLCDVKCHEETPFHNRTAHHNGY